jgi:hypothetical protein
MTYYCLVMHYIWFRLVISWVGMATGRVVFGSNNTRPLYKYPYPPSQSGNFSDLNVSPIYITRCMRCDT